MANLAPQWPQYTIQSFNSAISSDPSGKDESVFYGPYTRLLYSLFPLDGPFEVAPRFRHATLTSPRESIDLTVVLLVEVNRHPVFFIEVKPPASFPYDSKREEADKEMRRRFRDLRQILVVPRLYGISAFGCRLAFYEYDNATHELKPEQIQPHASNFLTDVAPASRWHCDILQPEGAKRFKEVVEKVKEMSAQV